MLFRSAFATDGRFFTIAADRLPGGRGMGEPVRLILDLANDDDLVALFIHHPGERLLVASSAGDGFIVGESEVIAQTRTGRQVLNVKQGVKAAICQPVTGDHVAVVGRNRKLLVFPMAELPEMTRGKGLRLQKYKDGGLADALCFAIADGLTWKDPAGRTRTERDLVEWQGKRAGAGRMATARAPRSGHQSSSWQRRSTSTRLIIGTPKMGSSWWKPQLSSIHWL